MSAAPDDADLTYKTTTGVGGLVQITSSSWQQRCDAGDAHLQPGAVSIGATPMASHRQLSVIVSFWHHLMGTTDSTTGGSFTQTINSTGQVIQ